ncbi:MAG: hypothetical protein LBQ51_08935, partial [Desulfovibrio sp.]|nr:hypothetical protein [Desulfovibrio sp.]
MPVTVKSFVDAARHAAPDTTLKFSDNEVTQTGAIGTAFTWASTHRESMARFINALRAKYGDSIAKTASAMLRGPMAEGKPLKAYMVTAMVRIAEGEQALARTRAVENFIRGDDPDLVENQRPDRTRRASPA